MSELDRLLSKAEVLRLVGFSYATVWAWMRAGRFPRSVVVGTGPAAKVAWRESEIRAWLDALPRSRLLGDPVETQKRQRWPEDAK
jgi:predicted DNA-binding transcriptional regulator AlpA